MSSTSINISKKFTHEIDNANFTNVMKLLTDKIQNGTGLLNQTTLNQLKRKHLQGKQTDFITIVADTSNKL